MLNLKIIKAITLDLDDTLWPVWPAIERAEKALENWLSQHAPMAAALFANASVRDDIRSYVVRTRPELKHNLSAVRREAIRTALYRAKENPLLAEAAFEVFYAERNRVTLFDDAIFALEFLSARYPIVALSNGNADIERIGIKSYFRASISAQDFGVGDSTLRGRSDDRKQRFGCAAAVGRFERPHHWARRPQHSHFRAAFRLRSHHRRHAGSRRYLLF